MVLSVFLVFDSGNFNCRQAGIIIDAHHGLPVCRFARLPVCRLDCAFHSGELAACQPGWNMFLNPFNDKLSYLTY